MSLSQACFVVLLTFLEVTLALNFQSQVYSDDIQHKPYSPLDPAFLKLEEFIVVPSVDKKYYFYGFEKDREFLLFV